MPGNPIEQELYAQIEREGGWEKIWDRVAGGENQTTIAKSLAVTQGFFSRVMHKDPARVLAFREAKKRAATYYAERQQEVIDEAPVERDAIAKAREQAGAYRWSARAWDRERFGDPTPGIDVTFNVGQMHLDSLRHRRADPLALPVPEPLELGPGDDDGTTVPAGS